jgi:DNA-directed RNA polymerase subunit RPC12/RpoP
MAKKEHRCYNCGYDSSTAPWYCTEPDFVKSLKSHKTVMNCLHCSKWIPKEQEKEVVK